LLVLPPPRRRLIIRFGLKHLPNDNNVSRTRFLERNEEQRMLLMRSRTLMLSRREGEMRRFEEKLRLIQ
jgi:hypothetical protein